MSRFIITPYNQSSIYFQQYLNEQVDHRRVQQIRAAERQYSRIRRLTEGPAQRDYDESFLGYREGSTANS